MIEKWLTNSNLDADLRKELNEMTEGEKVEAFSKNLEFGTAGMRGLLGAGTNRLNIYTVQKATLGLAKYLKRHYSSNEKISVAIGYDSRHKSYEFSQECARVLATYGIYTYIFDEVKPTPLLSYLVRRKQCQAGIMITASHNPKEYNGYKVYNDSGAQLNLEEGAELIELVNSVDDIFAEKFIEDYESYITYVDPSFDKKYLMDIRQLLLFGNEERDIKVVFTPVHGTSHHIMPQAFNYFNFKNLIPVEEQMLPDPEFTNCTSSNPEEIECYDLATEYAIRHDADIVIANDPDADRLGVLYKAEKGKYVPLSGNETGTLLIDYLINNDTKKTGKRVLYRTIVTGEMGSQIALENRIKVKELLTGFKFIGEQIKLTEGKETFFFGYEESYGYLINPIARDKDAIQAALLVAEMANHYKLQGITLGQKLEELYEKYGYYCEKTYSINLEGAEGMAKINRIMTFLARTNISEYNGYVINETVNYQKDDTGLPKADVIKFYLQDYGWIVFRPSGTEPKLKIYISIKSDSLEDAEKRNTELHARLRALVDRI